MTKAVLMLKRGTIAMLITMLIILVFLTISVLAAQFYENLLSFSAFLATYSLALIIWRFILYISILIFWVKIKNVIKEKSLELYGKLKRLLVFATFVVLIGEVSLLMRLGIILW